MFFWNSLVFLMIQQMLAIWSLVPLPFLKPAETSGSSWFTYCWSLAWRILSKASMWDECNCPVVWTFFGTALLWDWKENWPFQSCGHCWVFQICWDIEVASSLAINSYLSRASYLTFGCSSVLIYKMGVVKKPTPQGWCDMHRRMSGT